jgi:hypothetical protein
MKKFIIYVLIVATLISPLRINNPIKIRTPRFTNKIER